MAATYSPGDIVLSLFLKERTTPTGPFRVEIRLELKRDGVSRFLKDASMVYPSNGHFVGNKEYLKPGQLRVEMLLRPLAAASLDTLQSTLRFELKDSSNSTLETLNCAIDFSKRFFVTLLTKSDYFNSKLFENKNDATRNILLFGMAGSSKSSFINSCYTMLSDSLQMSAAQSGGSDERVTTEFRSYRLINLDTEEITRYRLWDTWGIERDNYKGQEFANIIQGRMGNRAKMEECTPPVGRISQYKKKEEIDEVQHCVIFFIPSAEIDDGSEIATSTVEYIRIATGLGISCIVALTKFDTSMPGFPKTSSSIKSPEVDKAIKRAANFFHLAPNRVFPLVNYFEENSKSFEVDRIVYRILEAASKVAESHVLTHKNVSSSASDQKKRSLMDS